MENNENLTRSYIKKNLQNTLNKTLLKEFKTSNSHNFRNY